MPGQTFQVPPAYVLDSVFLCPPFQDREPFFKLTGSPGIQVPAQLSALPTLSPLEWYKGHPGMGVSLVLQAPGNVLPLSLPGTFP